MSQINDIIKAIDNKLLETGKYSMLLQQASKMLTAIGLIENTAALKRLLENGAIPHAYKTKEPPRQWVFPLSKDGVYRKHSLENKGKCKSAQQPASESVPELEHNTPTETLQNTVSHIQGQPGSGIFCQKCGYGPLIPVRREESPKYILCPQCKSLVDNPFWKKRRQNFSTVLFDSIATILATIVEWWLSLTFTKKCIAGTIAFWLLLIGVDLSSGNSTILETGLTQSRAEMKVKQYLKNDYLFDSDSYKSVSWTGLREKSDGTYYITHTYRAKNSFGGFVQKTNIFHLDGEGNVIGIH